MSTQLQLPRSITVWAFISLLCLIASIGTPLVAQTTGSAPDNGSGTPVPGATSADQNPDSKGTTVASAADMSITRTVIGSGGILMSEPSYTLHGTVSQTTIGRVQTDENLHNVGFWYWAKQSKSFACIRLPQVEAFPGSTLTIPLLIEQTENFPDVPSLRFHARIRFNRSLLQPVSGTPECTQDGGDCLLDVEGEVTPESLKSGILAELKFMAKLGDAENTPLVIEDFAWIGLGEYQITTQLKDGLFTLLGICREGGEIRLVHSTGPASRIRVWPNPATSNASIEFMSSQEGTARLTLIDAIGREIATLSEQEAEAVKLYRVDVDLSSIPSGSYFLVLRTPTEIKTTRLTIDQ